MKVKPRLFDEKCKITLSKIENTLQIIRKR